MASRDDFPNINTKKPDGLKPGGKQYRVMVVEEKDFLRKQLVQILESEKYHVVAAVDNGQAALDAYKKMDGKLDLITTNLDMPILDGYALMYNLNQFPNRPPIVFVSEETTKGVMEDLIKMGISDFILKPIDRRLFLSRIKNVMNKYDKTQSEG